MKPTANTTRERIVAAASKLFYGQGIRAVSVDAVAEKAGLTKRTLYYHFASKDDLIAAYLERRDQPNLGLFRHWFTESEGQLADKVAAIFQHLAAAARRPAWKGCGFLRTAAELADPHRHCPQEELRSLAEDGFRGRGHRSRGTDGAAGAAATRRFLRHRAFEPRPLLYGDRRHGRRLAGAGCARAGPGACRAMNRGRSNPVDDWLRIFCLLPY